MYALNEKQATVMQISNDAFWYLYREEEMIDDENMEEINEIYSMFPNGFIISDNYSVVKDQTDLIECTIIPYTEDQIAWDGESVMADSKGLRTSVFLFKILGNDKCYLRWYDERNGKIFKEGEFGILYFNKNAWCDIPPENQNRRQHTLIPLETKRTKYFTNNRFCSPAT